MVNNQTHTQFTASSVFFAGHFFIPHTHVFVAGSLFLGKTHLTLSLQEQDDLSHT